ncbi:hypothetical protein JCM16303_002725 [Sporobolomyces ruberrimus]
MSDTSERDFISFLPNELLSDIFDKAYENALPPGTPISRAFLPFQQRALFHRVKISSSSQFESLIEAFEENSCLGGMVKMIELNDTYSNWSKAECQLRSFFSSLVNLEHLKLDTSCPSLVNSILSSHLIHSAVPRLSSLHVAFDVKEPFDSGEIYHNLEAYPSLRRLTVSHSRYLPFYWRSRGGRAITKVEELILKGHQVDGSSTVSFLRNFPNLASLEVDSADAPYSDYTTLLSNLPLSLTSLALRTCGNYGTWQSQPEVNDRHLAHLVNLEYLYLGQGTYTQDLIASLRQLPKLKTLGFGRGVGLSLIHLEELSIGPDALSSLEKLVFDQVEGKTGWRIGEDSGGMTLHPDHSKNPWHVGPGWILPKWSPNYPASYSECDMVALVGRIEGKCLTVEGTTIEALGVCEEFAIEVKRCLIAHATKTGDFGECRRRFGDEFVDAHLLALGSTMRGSEDL